MSNRTFEDFRPGGGAIDLDNGNYLGLLAAIQIQDAPDYWTMKTSDDAFRFTFVVWKDVNHIGQDAPSMVELSMLTGATLSTRSNAYKWLRAVLGDKVDEAPHLGILLQYLPAWCMIQSETQDNGFVKVATVAGIPAGMQIPQLDQNLLGRYKSVMSEAQAPAQSAPAGGYQNPPQQAQPANSQPYNPPALPQQGQQTGAPPQNYQQPQTGGPAQGYQPSQTAGQDDIPF